MNKLLLLQMGDVPAEVRALGGFGNFAQLFLNAADYCECNLEIIQAQREPLPPEAAGYSGIMVTGSPAMVTERAGWSEAAAAWLRRAIEQGAAVLGVCYGHQLIAHAFGGEVGWLPQGMELGTQTISLAPGAQEHRLLAGLPAAFPANLAHSQTVLVPPERAVVLAASAYDPHQILAYGERVVTVQFHPEFNGRIMRAYAAYALARRQPGDRPLLLGEPIRDTPEAAWILQSFLDYICCA